MSNEVVIYKGHKYNVLHKYESGYCEIRRVNDKNYYNVHLVKENELKKTTTLKLSS